ncbi:hypothetical protein BDN72DRAFT_894576 [Pluteus cervinus]|uniref:Uncharacterized protein n=1 Tax=Pluteus cervinus TaxID=181527 RepID=A0ACD3B537_9AGAR|nr:hypothetical protein BDN72DRAFT_894576 [Pluteus cervinus]
MPPPTVADSWLAGRHFGIVIDAGSSGSRIQIYSWVDPRTIHVEQGSTLARSLPKVEKGTQNGEDWVFKVEPGISSYADKPETLAEHLRPLLGHARNHVPPSLQHETPIFLLATAGMRLLPPGKQAQILHHTCRFFLLHSYFKLEESSEAGPCGSNVRIITGEEEGLFGWIAVNYLMDGFTGSSEDRTTFGFLDMGGASTQIAFEPGKEHRNDKNLIDVRLRLLGGDEIHHKVFVTTWLGYGTNKARERYVGHAIREQEKTKTIGSSDVIEDPCLPKDLELTEMPMQADSAPHAHEAHRLRGTGSFEQCMVKTSSLLNKTTPCPDSPCLMNGVHVPPIDFSVSHFIGVSEYWYSSEHIFGLGGAYDFVQYERAASDFCSHSWDSILKQHERIKAQHQPLGGDGEVEKDGHIVEVGRWDPSVERSRLEMQCFKAAWIANVLHEGLGMPRIVDAGGNGTTTGHQMEEQAEKKGLGKPTFQSVDTVGDIAISWTLGKMVLEASKEVQPASSMARPIVDPIDDLPNKTDSPIKPIRPPFFDLDAIEDRITPHLPVSLSRSSLGFSPVLLLLVFCLCFVFVVIIYPLRRHIRIACLRWIRDGSKRDKEADLLEEGIGLNGYSPGGSRPPSPTGLRKFLEPLRKVLPGVRSTRPAPLSVITSSNPNLRHMQENSSARVSPTRASFDPVMATTTASSISRSPSPAPAIYQDEIPNYMSGNGHQYQPSASSMARSLSSRSRNASQMSLSNSNGTALPRQTSLSRASSFHEHE